MSDLLLALARRTLALEPAVRPRARALYEPEPSALRIELSESSRSSAHDAQGAAEPARPALRGERPREEVGRSRAEHAAPEVGVPSPARAARPLDEHSAPRARRAAPQEDPREPGREASMRVLHEPMESADGPAPSGVGASVVAGPGRARPADSIRPSAPAAGEAAPIPRPVAGSAPSLPGPRPGAATQAVHGHEHEHEHEEGWRARAPSAARGPAPSPRSALALPWPREESRPAGGGAPVQVTIGRLELRVVAASSSAAVTRTTPRAAGLTLDEYLRTSGSSAGR